MLRLLPPSLRWRVYSRLTPDPYAPRPDKIVRRRINGCAMLLHESDWMERFASKAGCYYDLSTIAVLNRVLKPGSWMIDVGANVGFTALAAARVVGLAGRVIAFEPNQVAADRLKTNVALNNFQNIEVHEIGLAAEPGFAHLSEQDHHGTSSMRVGKGRLVTVSRGDEFAPPDGTPLLIKIDVEGFELEVLKGMPDLLRRPETIFLIEVTEKWLRAAGGSAEELFSLLSDYTSEIPIFSPWSGLHLRPLDPAMTQYDVLFTRKP